MRTAYYNESHDRSVFNDYEESIIFDEDDPDFRPSDDLECSCNKNGKLVYKLSRFEQNLSTNLYVIYIVICRYITYNAG